MQHANINAYAMHIKMDMPGNGEDYCIDAVRSFYNFLMSAGTLIDHYRVAVQAGSFPKAFKTDYDTKVASIFQNDLLAACVKKLRNFTTHRSLPSTSVEWDFAGTKTYRLLLDTVDLMRWSGWNQQEKAYLTSLQPKEDAIRFFMPYFVKSEQLYHWFMREYCNHFPAEQADLAGLYEKIPGTP
ncbi:MULTISPECIES: hypothetical protein [unclassified Undibacterium]|uniref:hypothetical protein n=1 Tax=unclassified Undibacterium TaxID=2630295 RepID=UPI00339604AE